MSNQRSLNLLGNPLATDIFYFHLKKPLMLILPILFLFTEYETITDLIYALKKQETLSGLLVDSFLGLQHFAQLSSNNIDIKGFLHGPATHGILFQVHHFSSNIFLNDICFSHFHNNKYCDSKVYLLRVVGCK